LSCTFEESADFLCDVPNIDDRIGQPDIKQEALDRIANFVLVPLGNGRKSDIEVLAD